MRRSLPAGLSFRLRRVVAHSPSTEGHSLATARVSFPWGAASRPKRCDSFRMIAAVVRALPPRLAGLLGVAPDRFAQLPRSGYPPPSTAGHLSFGGWRQLPGGHRLSFAIDCSTAKDHRRQQAVSPRLVGLLGETRRPLFLASRTVARSLPPEPAVCVEEPNNSPKVGACHTKRFLVSYVLALSDDPRR